MISFLFHNLDFLYGYQRGAGKVLLERSGISRASWNRYCRDANIPVHRLIDIMNAMRIGPDRFFGAMGYRVTVADIAPDKDFVNLRIDFKFLDKTVRTSSAIGGPNMKDAAMAIGVSETWFPKLFREESSIDAEQLCRIMNLYNLELGQVFVPADAPVSQDEGNDDMLSEDDQSTEFKLNAARKHIANLEERVKKLELITTKLLNLHRKKKI